jgi:hypothetical protein
MQMYSGAHTVDNEGKILQQMQRCDVTGSGRWRHIERCGHLDHGGCSCGAVTSLAQVDDVIATLAETTDLRRHQCTVRQRWTGVTCNTLRQT